MHLKRAHKFIMNIKSIGEIFKKYLARKSKLVSNHIKHFSVCLFLTKANNFISFSKGRERYDLNARSDAFSLRALEDKNRQIHNFPKTRQLEI